MKKKYLINIIKGVYKGREGYVLETKPNDYGNILWYSKEDSGPYIGIIPFENIEFKGVDKLCISWKK